ncbi:MAG: hypothetical protein D6739_00670, partial [Nitrospirae bacterium]
MERLARLAERYPEVPERALLKAHLLFEGLRLNRDLLAAAAGALPGFRPYAPTPEERARLHLPEAVTIPYLLVLAGGELVRVKCDPESPYEVVAAEGGLLLLLDGSPVEPVAFQPRPAWWSRATRDGRPLPEIGLSQHGDMLVANPAPGCDLFTARDEAGRTLQCRFCAYGRPDRRSRALGQVAGRGPIEEAALARLVEGVVAAAPEVRHLYLVSGSLTDPRAEGERYRQLAEALLPALAAAGLRVPVTAGPSALHPEDTAALRRAGAAAVCYNLEVWGEPLFAAVCPGKQRFVGFRAWLERLEAAVAHFGRGNVLTAMVAGVEVDLGLLDPEAALANAVEGAAWLLERGICPLYSLHWSTRHATYGRVSSPAFDYFLRLNAAVAALRRDHGLPVPGHVVCGRCAYMQLDTEWEP